MGGECFAGHRAVSGSLAVRLVAVERVVAVFALVWNFLILSRLEDRAIGVIAAALDLALPPLPLVAPGGVNFYFNYNDNFYEQSSVIFYVKTAHSQ